MPVTGVGGAGPLSPQCDAVPDSWGTAKNLLRKISEGSNSGKLGTYNLWVGSTLEPHPTMNRAQPNELLAAVARGQAVSIEQIKQKGTWGRSDALDHVFKQPTQQPPTSEINVRALVEALQLKLGE